MEIAVIESIICCDRTSYYKFLWEWWRNNKRIFVLHRTGILVNQRMSSLYSYKMQNGSTLFNVQKFEGHTSNAPVKSRCTRIPERGIVLYIIMVAVHIIRYSVRKNKWDIFLSIYFERVDTFEFCSNTKWMQWRMQNACFLSLKKCAHTYVFHHHFNMVICILRNKNCGAFQWHATGRCRSPSRAVRYRVKWLENIHVFSASAMHTSRFCVYRACTRSWTGRTTNENRDINGISETTNPITKFGRPRIQEVLLCINIYDDSALLIEKISDI